jgi:PAS domain S-box-containing protein
MDKESKKSETERLLDQIEEFVKMDFADPQFKERLPEVFENFRNAAEELQVVEEELRQQNEELQDIQALLSAQRKEYQTLFEMAPSGYLITDEFGMILEFNRAVQELLRIAQDSPKKLPLVNRIFQREHKTFWAQLAQVNNSESVQEWEQTLVAADGRHFPALVRATRLAAHGDQGKRILWLIHDITERKEREKVRENVRVFAESLFQAVREPLLALTDDLKVMLANASFSKTFETAKNETEGRYLYELSDGEFDIPAVRSLLSELVSSRRSFEDFQIEHEFKNIGRRILLLNARRLSNRELGPIILLALEDVTQRVDGQRRLEQVMRELRQSNQELEQFAYLASHDLQEPLRMVTSYVQLLAKRYRGHLDSDADEFIGFAVDGANRMKALIESLLQYSRLQTRAREPEPVSAEQVLRKTLVAMQHVISENQAIVTHDPLPAILADPAQLSMVFQNLLENAIKFRREEPPAIHISAVEHETEWLFSFRDNGIGIEERHKERIFRLFQRLQTRSESSGTGIGLAICKRVVERHGGRIWLESTPGQGTTFYFTLPRRQT